MSFGKSSKGFSLVEVMIVVGVMSIVTLGSARFIISQSKSIGFMEDRITWLSLKQELGYIMSDRAHCASLLKNIVLKPNASLPLKIENELGRVIFDPALSDNQFGKLNLSEGKIRNINVAGPQSVGEVEVSILVKRKRSGGGPQTLNPVSARFPWPPTIPVKSKAVSPLAHLFVVEILLPNWE
jgi:prepilin-type N-terminal cleavage/methylation domain-containing protein